MGRSAWVYFPRSRHQRFRFDWVSRNRGSLNWEQVVCRRTDASSRGYGGEPQRGAGTNLADVNKSVRPKAVQCQSADVVSSSMAVSAPSKEEFNGNEKQCKAANVGARQSVPARRHP